MSRAPERGRQARRTCATCNGALSRSPTAGRAERRGCYHAISRPHQPYEPAKKRAATARRHMQWWMAGSVLDAMHNDYDHQRFDDIAVVIVAAYDPTRRARRMERS